MEFKEGYRVKTPYGGSGKAFTRGIFKRYIKNGKAAVIEQHTTTGRVREIKRRIEDILPGW